MKLLRASWKSSRLLSFRLIGQLNFFSSGATDERLQRLLKIMPKETTLRHIRQRALGNVQAPSEAYFQVVGDGSLGAPKVVILITSSSRYLFNCGEGTQRIIQEHKLRLSRVENIFFTSQSWKNVGGLPGLSLTVKDIGVPKLTLHGPPEVGQIYPMTKRFLQIQEMEIEHRGAADQSFEDEAITITYVPIHADAARRSTETDDEPAAKRSRWTPPVENLFTTAVAYIGKLAPKPGTLSMAECIKRGVPPGPLLAKLKEGCDVQLKSGTTVRSVDVCGPPLKGPVFIVVECPSVNHIESLVANKVFAKHQQTASSDDDRAELVVHFTPADVISDPRYDKWMSSFSASTAHWILNGSNHNPHSVAIHRIQAMLNMIDDAIFPLLPAQRENSSVVDDCESGGDSKVIIRGRPLQKYYIRPQHKKLLEDQCFTLNNEDYRSEASENDGLKEELDLFKAGHRIEPYKNDLSQPEVIFFGTGSAIPSKVRNTSSTLIRLSNRCSILMDCGEGTLGQFLRFFTPQEAVEEMKRLKAVMISHPHADHHLGLISILQHRRALSGRDGIHLDKLFLFLPEPVEPYIHLFNEQFYSIAETYEVVPCYSWMTTAASTPGKERILSSLGLSAIQVTQVIHCPHSYGFSVKSEGGLKICFSGDTMPCDRLIQIGMDCDLLIHEATMEDSMAEEAAKKQHSTTAQAIEVGRRMNAKFTMLTHFSQRYAKIPFLAEDLPRNVGIAFDNMRVRLSDLPVIPAMLPAMKLMFSEHYELMQERSEKRERRLEWEKKGLKPVTNARPEVEVT